MFLAADMQLFHFVTRAFLTKNGKPHTAAPSLTRVVSLISLNVARKHVIETVSLESNGCAYICDLNFSTISKILLDTASS